MDAVSVIVKGINNMLKKDPDVFRNTFRRGQVYNNGTRGINCKSDPAIPWKHGPAIMRNFRSAKVSLPLGFHDLTTPGVIAMLAPGDAVVLHTNLQINL